MPQVDKRKVGALSLAIQVAFQQMGVFETSNTKLPLSTSGPMPFQDVQARAWLQEHGFHITQTGGDVFIQPAANPDQLDLLKTGKIDSLTFNCKLQYKHSDLKYRV